LWGEHNLFGSAQYVVNDLMNVSAAAIHNVEQRWSILTAQYLYNVLQNAYLTLYVRYFHGLPLSPGGATGYDLQYATRVEVRF
jgi:hypothetical protein